MRSSDNAVWDIKLCANDTQIYTSVVGLPTDATGGSIRESGGCGWGKIGFGSTL